ncbi:HD domain-containing protein [Alloscardovia theropitheci]|uniref:HD domain-containing protein n=1 Tax=Alloscardovia theropitheci TaxID=2496842 RepID=A0A4R0QXL1_9BIFI|nr:HD domain-containing protein [Alloscardovia theropitheci]TCD54201.1 HD domain-containing protein [Alloscardovia theropitheci]
MMWDGWELTDNTRRLRELHVKLATETGNPEQAFNLIATHCEIVARIALKIAVATARMNAVDSSSTVDLADLIPIAPPSRNVNDINAPSDSDSNRNLLIEGALAHDIGTYSVLDPANLSREKEPIFCKKDYIQHGLRGYDILIDNGFKTDIAYFARNHTGVGITRDDCIKQNLNLPVDDYVAQTVLQEIVMLADKFHTKSLPAKFVSASTAARRCEKFGAENRARWDKLESRFVLPSHDVLEELAQEYEMSVI